MNIRQASLEDIRQVKNIVDALQVSRKEQKDWMKKPYGFFEYPFSEEELRKGLNTYFSVAENSHEIEGFALGYDDNFMRDNFAGKGKENIDFFLNEFGKRFLYLDMLGVKSPDSISGKLSAGKLALRTIELAKDNGLKRIVSCVCEKPWKNERSIAFGKKLGFNRFGSISYANDICVGFYELGL